MSTNNNLHWKTKPSIIEYVDAIQYDGTNNPFGALRYHKCDYRMCPLCGGANEDIYYLSQSDGQKIVRKGSYVVEHRNGKLSVLHETIFLSMYEPI